MHRITCTAIISLLKLSLRIVLEEETMRNDRKWLFKLTVIGIVLMIVTLTCSAKLTNPPAGAVDAAATFSAAMASGAKNITNRIPMTAAANTFAVFTILLLPSFLEFFNLSKNDLLQKSAACRSHLLS